MTSYLNPSTRSGGVEQIVVPERQTVVPVDDAPFDDEQYVRVNGEWVPYEAPPIIPDTLAPKPPTGLDGTGTMAGDGSSVTYLLEWDAPTQNTDNSPLTDFAYYVLRWRYAGLTSWSTLTTNDTEYLLPNLVPAINIEWEVLARDTSGNDSAWASDTVVGVADTTPPIAPSQPGLGSRLGAVVATWDGLLVGATAPPADFSYLEVYTSATSGGPWETIGRLNGPGASVVAGIEVGVERFFSFIAFDSSGNASPRSATPSIVVQGVTGPDIEANAITANMINTGIMSAAMTITGYLLAGDPEGSRVVIDGAGIRQYDATGTLLTNIPTDPDLPATFEGAMIADSITIKDYMSLQGLANKIARGAVLTLEGGTSAPSAAPSVAISYPTYQPPSFTAEYLYIPVGHNCDVDDSDNIVGAKTFYGYGKLLGRSGKYWIGAWYTDSEGGIRTKYGNIGSATVVAVGGAERLVINSVYTTGNGATPVGRITSFDPATMTNTGSAEPPLKAQRQMTMDNYLYYARLGRVLGGLTGTQYPERLAMGLLNWNGSLYESGKITLRQYTVTDNVILDSGFTLVAGSEKVITTPLASGENLIGVTHGRADKLGYPATTGAAVTDFLWLVHGSVKTYAYNATAGMTRITDYDFDTPPGAKYMNAWGNPITNSFTGFRTTEWDANKPVTKLTNNHWVGATSSKWWMSSTNFDADITGGTHQSPQGPRASLTMKKRAGLTITVPPYPVRPSPTTTDDPLSAKIYIGRGSADPGRTYMEYAGQTDDPNRTLVIGDFTFPAGLAVTPPPIASDFPASAPAKIQSADAATWVLQGDGNAKVGTLEVGLNGGTTLKNAMEMSLGDVASTSQRLMRFFKKAASGANYYESREYIYNDGTVSGKVAGILENDALVANFIMRPNAQFDVQGVGVNVGKADFALQGVSIGRGVVPGGYDELTATSATTVNSGTPVNIAELAVTVNMPAGRRVKISVMVHCRSTVANDRALVYAREGSTALGFSQGPTMTVATSAYGIHFATVTEPTAGSHTYVVSVARLAGTGVISTSGATTGPAYIMVEDIGAAGT